MSDPTIILAITSISAVGIGILGKLLYQLRHNIRTCWGIQFRSTSTSRHSPKLQELNQVKQHFANTLPDSSTIIQHVTPQNIPVDTIIADLEKQIRIKELQTRLKKYDPGNQITKDDVICLTLPNNDEDYERVYI